MGILRTLPPASDDRVAALRAVSSELRHPWRDGQTYADRVRSIDTRRHRPALRCSRRRCAPTAGPDMPSCRGTPRQHHEHAALAAPYVHVTAPLRRLVDRFANQIVLDLVAGREVSAWVVDALDDLPGLMARATQRAAAIDRAAADLVDAVVLRGRVGQVLPTVTVDRRDDDRGAPARSGGGRRGVRHP